MAVTAIDWDAVHTSDGKSISKETASSAGYWLTDIEDANSQDIKEPFALDRLELPHMLLWIACYLVAGVGYRRGEHGHGGGRAHWCRYLCHTR